MKSYFEAYRIVKEEMQNLVKSSEEVCLLDSLNRVNSKDIYSDSDLPYFDNSAMDGIVINFKEGIYEWKITGEISAGNFKQLHIDQDSAALIMTGAKIPYGGNTVIPVEDLDILNGSAVLKKKLLLNAGRISGNQDRI